MVMGRDRAGRSPWADPRLVGAKKNAAGGRAAPAASSDSGGFGLADLLGAGGDGWGRQAVALGDQLLLDLGKGRHETEVSPGAPGAADLDELLEGLGLGIEVFHARSVQYPKTCRKIKLE